MSDPTIRNVGVDNDEAGDDQAPASHRCEANEEADHCTHQGCRPNGPSEIDELSHGFYSGAPHRLDLHAHRDTRQSNPQHPNHNPIHGVSAPTPHVGQECQSCESSGNTAER